MPPKINPNEIQWDAPAAIDPDQVQWDAAPAQQPMTEGEELASSIPSRFIAGVTSPAKVLLKLVGPDSIKKQLADVEAMRQRGMEKRGTGFDFAGLAGSMVPSSLISKGVAAAVPAVTGIGKIGQGALTGAATSAATPLAGGQDELSMEKVKQILMGGGIGGAVSAVGQGVKAFFGSNKLNPTQQATLKEGQAAGYTVPPSMVNPSGLNNTLESLAGKDAVKQAAAARNQKITNALSSKALGLPVGQPVTPGALQSVRDQAGQVYDAVENLSPNAKVALRELRDARHKTNLHFNHYFKSADPDALDKAEYQKGLANLFDQEIENEARNAGRTDLVQALARARTKIAKTYEIEKALSEASSDVSAPTLGRAFDAKGGKAMTGELATIGKMADAFKPVMREGASVPVAGVSGTDALASAMLGGIGLGTSGPLGAGAAALPWIMRPAARNLVLSKPYQKIAEGIPARYLPLIDALNQQAAGAAGMAAGRNQ